MTIKTLRLLTKHDQKQYEALLKESFGNALGFTVRPEALKWGKDQEYFPTLGLFNDQKLKAVTGLHWVATWPKLKYYLHADFQNSEVTLPVALTTKAATALDQKGLGLNSVLRYHCITIAMKWEVSHLMSTMVEGSPRVFTMEQMGYEFQKNPKKWDGYFISDKPALIAYLNLKKNGPGALAYLEKTNGALIQSYKSELDLDSISMTLP